MKYFLQFEGREKLLLKVVLVMQIVIIGLLVWFCMRPNYLYVDTEQLKEIQAWQRQGLEEHQQKEKAKVAEQSD